MKKDKENEREALVAKTCPPNSTFAYWILEAAHPDSELSKIFLANSKSSMAAIALSSDDRVAQLDTSAFSGSNDRETQPTFGSGSSRLGRFICPISIAGVGISWDVSSSAF